MTAPFDRFSLDGLTPPTASGTRKTWNALNIGVSRQILYLLDKRFWDAALDLPVAINWEGGGLEVVSWGFLGMVLMH